MNGRQGNHATVIAAIIGASATITAAIIGNFSAEKSYVLGYQEGISAAQSQIEISPKIRSPIMESSGLASAQEPSDISESQADPIPETSSSRESSNDASDVLEPAFRLLSGFNYVDSSVNSYRENEVVVGGYFKDNYENTYNDYISYNRAYGSCWNEYNLKKTYSLLEGSLAINFDKRTLDCIVMLKLYGDDNLIYASPAMTAGSEPVPVSVNISDVTKLRLEFSFVPPYNRVAGDSMNLALLDCKLSK